MKAVVFAAGLGKRLRPLTSERPKHLLPVCGKPILRRVLESLLLNGVDDVGVVVHYMADLIIREVEDYELDMNIEWIHQEAPLGTGDALRACEKFLDGEDYFIIAYGDITLSGYVIEDLLRYFEKNECDGVIEGVYVEDTLRFGRIILGEDGLERVEEKSIGGPGMVSAGVYILPYEAINASREVKPSLRGEYELTDIINLLAARNYRILMHTSTKDWWIDIGSPTDYLKANIKKFLEEYGEKVVCKPKFDETVVVKPPSMILEGAEIAGRAAIGPNAFIMKDVKINPDTRVEDSVLLDGCYVRSGCVLRRVIVGDYAQIGEGVKIDGGEEVSIIPPKSRIEGKGSIGSP